MARKTVIPPHTRHGGAHAPEPPVDDTGFEEYIDRVYESGMHPGVDDRFMEKERSSNGDHYSTARSDELSRIRQERDNLVAREADLRARIVALERENAELRSSQSPVGREDEQREAERLTEEHGIIFSYLPSDAYPKRPYITPQELEKSGVVKYRPHHVRLLIRNGVVEAGELAGKRVLYPSSVRALYTRQFSEQVRALGGRPVGYRVCAGDKTQD